MIEAGLFGLVSMILYAALTGQTNSNVDKFFLDLHTNPKKNEPQKHHRRPQSCKRE